MRELARVLDRLRKLGICGMLSDSCPWDALEELLERWNNDAELREVRDKLALHFDDGLSLMRASPTSATWAIASSLPRRTVAKPTAGVT